MRYYAIKHKTLDKYVIGFNFTGKGKNAHWVLNCFEGKIKESVYLDIASVNSIIERAVHYKAHTQLDDYTIENFEKRYVPIKGTIRIKTVRDRIEQRIMVAKLKSVK